MFLSGITLSSPIDSSLLTPSQEHNGVTNEHVSGMGSENSIAFYLDTTCLEDIDIQYGILAATKAVNASILCHRVGRKEEGKNRGVFIKITSIQKRNLIYAKKKHLKGTGVVVREDLTSLRAELLRKAIEKIGLRNVWTENGKIFAIFNKKKIIIRNIEDFSDM
nr:unnamed protein product [Callosobruchus analis]